MLLRACVASAALALAAADFYCATDLDCSLNGVCNGGVCKCDKPWGGLGCGVLQYRTDQKVAAKNLYPHDDADAPKSGPCVTANHTCDALNTWNGPITFFEGKYHMFNPLYAKGSLLTTTNTLYGVADAIEGPYNWTKWDNLGGNPAYFRYQDPAQGNATVHTIWTVPAIYTSRHIDGPYTPAGKIPDSHGNPAPFYHAGRWYLTGQKTTTIWTAANIGDEWLVHGNVTPVTDIGNREDPFFWIDARGNWHVINHVYDVVTQTSCGSSPLSDHLFSRDGKEWHKLTPTVQPYTHTVRYEDGTAHTYTTLERPWGSFNAAGQLTHINLAADLMTQDAGCASYDHCLGKPGHCPCANCKYADHAGTIIIALDLD